MMIKLCGPAPTCYQQDSTELNHTIQEKDWLDEFGGGVQKGEGSAISDYLRVKLSRKRLESPGHWACWEPHVLINLWLWHTGSWGGWLTPPLATARLWSLLYIYCSS